MNLENLLAVVNGPIAWVIGIVVYVLVVFAIGWLLDYMGFKKGVNLFMWTLGLPIALVVHAVMLIIKVVTFPKRRHEARIAEQKRQREEEDRRFWTILTFGLTDNDTRRVMEAKVLERLTTLAQRMDMSCKHQESIRARYDTSTVAGAEALDNADNDVEYSKKEFWKAFDLAKTLRLLPPWVDPTKPSYKDFLKSRGGFRPPDNYEYKLS